MERLSHQTPVLGVRVNLPAWENLTCLVWSDLKSVLKRAIPSG
jgi:hypothetical protein